MKIFRILILILCLHFTLLRSSSQQPVAGQAPVAAAQTSPPAVMDQIRNTVGFITVVFQDGDTRKGAIGTCFFISVLDKRLGEGQAFMYLITNRHVAEPGIDLGTPYTVLGALLRLNLKTTQGGVQSIEQPILFANETHWYFPKDDAVDLAVLPIAPDHQIYSYVDIPNSLIVGSEQVESGDVVVGDRVTFAGYFNNFPGQKRIEPIVRQGVIAMLPDEDLDTTLRKQGRIYLADLHAFHGNSGSPVFVNVSGSHHGKLELGEKYLLLGLLSGFYPESVGYSVATATVLTGEVRDNSGIATIVPAEEIKKLLNSSELQAQRDREASKLQKKP